MALELDDETLEALGWGDAWGSVRRWVAWWRRRKSALDWARRDPLAERARDRARSRTRVRSEAYMERKRRRDRERAAMKRARQAVCAGRGERNDTQGGSGHG